MNKHLSTEAGLRLLPAPAPEPAAQGDALPRPAKRMPLQLSMCGEYGDGVWRLSQELGLTRAEVAILALTRGLPAVRQEWRQQLEAYSRAAPACTRLRSICARNFYEAATRPERRDIAAARQLGS